MMLHRWDLCGFWGASSNCRSCMTQKNCFDFDFDFWYWKSARNCWDECFLPYWQVTRCTLASVAITDISETRESFLAGLNRFIFLTYLKKKKTFSDVCMMTMMLDYILSIMHTFSSYSFQWVDRSQEILLWFCKLVLKNIYIHTSIRPYEKLFN